MGFRVTAVPGLNGNIITKFNPPPSASDLTFVDTRRLPACPPTHPAMSTEPKTKQIDGPKNGGSRVIPHPSQKAPKWYPADDIKQPKKVRKTPRPTKLRPSVLIPPPLTVCLFPCPLLFLSLLSVIYSGVWVVN